MASSLVHAEQELARLGQFVDGLSGQLVELWTEFDTRRDEWIRDRDSEEQRLTEERSALAAETLRLAESFEAHEQQGSTLGVALAEAQRALQQRDQELADLRTATDEARQASEAATSRESELAQRFEAVEAELKAARERGAELEAELADLANRSTNDEVTLAKCAALEAEAAELREQCAALQQASAGRDAETDRQANELRKALERTREELASRQQEWEVERGAAADNWRAKLEAAETELRDTRAQQARMAHVAVDLADARAELAQVREELRLARESSTSRKDSESPESERQIAELQKQRGALEQELESVRYRAAELAETAAEERRRMAEERSAWASELKALRKTLEHPNPRREAPRAAEPALTNTTPSEAAVRDTVLESVMAQFEKLQKDAVARRGRPAVQRQ